MRAELTIEVGETLRMEASAGTVLRIRSGRAWITQPADPRDYDLKPGKAIGLNGQGPVLIKAYEPTLLDLYREDPERLRRRIERDARMARSSGLQAAASRLARAAVRVLQRAREPARRSLPWISICTKSWIRPLVSALSEVNSRPSRQPSPRSITLTTRA